GGFFGHFLHRITNVGTRNRLNPLRQPIVALSLLIFVCHELLPQGAAWVKKALLYYDELPFGTNSAEAPDTFLNIRDFQIAVAKNVLVVPRWADVVRLGRNQSHTGFLRAGEENLGRHRNIKSGQQEYASLVTADADFLTKYGCKRIQKSVTPLMIYLL